MRKKKKLSQEDIEQLLQEAWLPAEEAQVSGKEAQEVVPGEKEADAEADKAGTPELSHGPGEPEDEQAGPREDAGHEGETSEPGNGMVGRGEEMSEPGESPEQVPSIRVAEFEEFEVEPVSDKPISDIGVLMDIPLTISVELGKSKCYVKDLLNLTAGSIVELDRLAGDPVDILVNGKLFAKGEVVVIDENFGVRIQEVLGKEKSR
jgi:flagellar motor switch protein FliN/FliY